MVWNFSFAQLHTNYSIKEGLPSSQVYRITQDAKGFIWAITDKGMVKFNGKELDIFNSRQGLPMNDIWDISITPDNRVWYFSKAAKLGYIENDSIRSFPSGNPGEILFPSTIYRLENNIIFGFHDRWFYLKQHNVWTEINSETQNFKINKTDSIVLDRFKRYHKVNSKFTQQYRGTFRQLRFRIKDSLSYWFYDEGYSVLNLESERIVHHRLPKALLTKDAYYLRFHFVNDEVQLTGKDFVARLDKNFEIAEIAYIPIELQSHFSMIDRTGNVWAATLNNGFYKLPQAKRNSKYFLENTVINELNILDDDVIAGAHFKGFYRYTGDTLTPILSKPLYAFQTLQIDPLHKIYYVFNREIIEEDMLSQRRITRPNVARGLVYIDGFLYGNVSSGINKIDPHSFEIVKSYNQIGVRKLFVFQNRLIIGTADGLRFLENDSISVLGNGLKDLQNPILNLKSISSNKFLVTTDGYGSFVTDLKTSAILPKSDNLSVQDAYIETGSIWLATERGVMEYSHKEGERLKFIRLLDENDGLPSRKVNSVAVLNGEIIVSTDNGLAIFPKGNKSEDQMLEIYFKSLNYNNLDITINNNEFGYSKDNTLSCTVSFVNYYENNNGLEYQYQLKPIQKNWVSTTSKSVSFPDLKPNEYTFSIRSKGLEKTIAFSIKPLWWQHTITRVAFVLLLITLAGWILLQFRKREMTKKLAKLESQKQLAEFELYALRSQMNPHFVFNSLAAIQYCINNNEVKTAESYLVKFSKLVRQFFEISKEKEVTIATEVALLKNYLDIEKLRFKDKLHYEIYISPSINTNETVIPTMLLQPIVENAINHGIFNLEDAGEVSIIFESLDDTLKVEIKDSGVGFAKTRKGNNHKRKSSNVLESRVRFMNETTKWNISYSNKEAYPNRLNKGNITTFIIQVRK